MKTNALSDRDITDILKQQGIKLNGIFMKDQLPKKLKKGFYVVNLASETANNGGTHWLSFYYSPKESFYFDAFGFIAPLEVDQILKSYIYSTSNIQDISSTACGFYCIAFILYMNGQKNKEEGFKKFIHHFSSDTEENDKKLYNFLYN
jgi:hypothetical protein